jgi:YidC/Oxa1 family membrane protein insertase
MLALPVVFVPFVIGFPAGLLVYWITTNVWTLLQQFTIRETLGRRWDHQHAEALAAAGGDPTAAFGHRKQGLFGSMMTKAQQAQQTAKTDGGGARRSSGGGRSSTAAKTATPAASTGDGTAKRSAPPPPPRKKKKRSGRRR